ncbi:hypothetical protein [Acutalibacter caecimuris]|uniref:hypothetical protein n=1 Tax=Acutalibacter caecimuris TaxID=3093657 RepID=UPI002AC8B690|nr:hypothetical protein [Acutalibacter sp. M00118]
MAWLYHGSPVEGIRRLRAGSRLHGTGEPVLYLTDSPAYALFYIWDVGRTGYPCKHVTAWLDGGIAQYEEQFAGQLAAFYQGAAGWLYRVERTPEMLPVPGREGLFSAPADTPVAGADFIPDVYAALEEQAQEGRARIWRFTERTPEKQAELTGMIAQAIAQNGFYRGRPEEGFFRRYFADAWERAQEAGHGA